MSWAGGAGKAFIGPGGGHVYQRGSGGARMGSWGELRPGVQPQPAGTASPTSLKGLCGGKGRWVWEREKAMCQDWGSPGWGGGAVSETVRCPPISTPAPPAAPLLGPGPERGGGKFLDRHGALRRPGGAPHPRWGGGGSPPPKIRAALPIWGGPPGHYGAPTKPKKTGGPALGPRVGLELGIDRKVGQWGYSGGPPQGGGGERGGAIFGRFF